MAIIRRIPKVGFKPRTRTIYQVVKLNALNKFDAKTVIDADKLKAAQLISSRRRPYKILLCGELTKALTVKAYAFSVGAAEKIKSAGGSIEVIIPGKQLEIMQMQQKKKDAKIARKANNAKKAKKA